jgi:antitoxin MazE
VKIARWGHALAVRLPASLVEELGLREGDEITLTPNRYGALDIAFAQRHERATDWMRGPDPRDRFDPRVIFLGLDQPHDQDSATGSVQASTSASALLP